MADLQLPCRRRYLEITSTNPSDYNELFRYPRAGFSTGEADDPANDTPQMPDSTMDPGDCDTTCSSAEFSEGSSEEVEEENSNEAEEKFGGEAYEESSKEANRDSDEETDEEGNEGVESPFFGFTVQQVYEFWRKHLQAVDYLKFPQRLSAFSFVVIDEACLPGEIMDCIICTDAPDYGESDEGVPVLKTIRTSASHAWVVMVALEEMTMTPSECEYMAKNLDDWGYDLENAPSGCLNLIRPARFVILEEDEEGNVLRRREATPREARINKENGIDIAELHGWVALKGFPKDE